MTIRENRPQLSHRWMGALIRTANALLAVVAATAAAAAVPTDAERPARVENAYAVTDVNIIDVMTGRALPHRDVLIRAGRIEAIEPANRHPAWPGARIVEGRGKYLAPGLIDMHIHLNHRLQARMIAPLLTPEPDDLISVHQLSLLLYNGVTTAQVMHGERPMLAVRDQIAAGRLLGPRLVVSSPRLDGYPLPDPVVRPVIGAREAEAVVDELWESGFDFIKVYDQLDAETHAAIVARAHKRGLRVDGHLPRTLPLAVALAHGQDHVAHIEEFVSYAQGADDAGIAKLAQTVKAAGIGVTPTLTVFRNLLRSIDDLDGLLREPEVRMADPIVYRSWLPDQNPYRAERFQQPKVRIALGRQYVLMRGLTLAFARAGVALSAGSDCSISGTVCGFSLHDELAELAGLGLDNGTVLRMATIEAARALGLASRLGSVTVGKQADLVLLEANPLVDIRASRRIAGLFLGGRLLDKSTLAGMLEDAEDAFARLDRRLGIEVDRPRHP